MAYEVISFDLQGTISNAAFSDEFWIDLLPQLYGEKYKLSIEESKMKLKETFKSIGRYDFRYYSFDYWLEAFNLNLDWNALLLKIKNKACYIPEMQEIVLKTSEKYPLLLFSATTKQFIHHELGDLTPRFKWIFSALDDLKCAGKPPQAFQRISTMINIAPNKILHIGDDPLMDYQNSKAAGWNSIHFTKESVPQICKLLDIS